MFALYYRCCPIRHLFRCIVSISNYFLLPSFYCASKFKYILTFQDKTHGTYRSTRNIPPRLLPHRTTFLPFPYSPYALLRPRLPFLRIQHYTYTRFLPPSYSFNFCHILLLIFYLSTIRSSPAYGFATLFLVLQYQNVNPLAHSTPVATLALGSRPRQRGCKGAGQEEAGSHIIYSRECKKV
jgi:hypothetical protein